MLHAACGRIYIPDLDKRRCASFEGALTYVDYMLLWKCHAMNYFIRVTDKGDMLVIK